MFTFLSMQSFYYKKYFTGHKTLINLKNLLDNEKLSRFLNSRLLLHKGPTIRSKGGGQELLKKCCPGNR